MSSLDDAFKRLLPLIEADLQVVIQISESSSPLFSRMLGYQLGWVDRSGKPAPAGSRGKRIRPVLALLVSEAACGDAQPARPPAAAVELIHNFSLIHDDIQDRSPTRHNRPTIWKAWGDAQGINAGDAMFALAHLTLPRLAAPQADRNILFEMLTVLDETCLELTRGQHLDIAFESRRRVTVDEYLDMITGKTAALIGGAAQMSALAAGANIEDVQHYRAFGLSLGMAFQIRDDLLDIWGKAHEIGKEAALDIRQRKKSLPVLYGLARSEELQALYAKPEAPNKRTIARIIRLLEQLGARDYAEGLADDYSRQTYDHLQAASPQPEAGGLLRDLVARLLQRSF